MKKSMFFAVASLFAFAACSNEEDPVVQSESEKGSIVFELSAVNQLSDGMSSRAVTAPIYSQEATQHVTNVVIYAFVQNGSDYQYVTSYNVTGWSDGTTSVRYVVTDKLSEGNYRFIAVGRDASDNFTVGTPLLGSSYTTLLASITAPGQETEIFAGSSDASFSDEGGRVSIEMTRKVAGVLGYFKNVPQQLNGSTVKFLRLKISNSNKKANLYSGVGSDPTSASYNIIDMDLSGQTVTNGVFVGNTVPGGVAKVANSQLSGAYYMPVATVTMTLGLYDSNGVVLKEWAVKNESNATSFDIAANHFYSLGMKKVAASTDGGTPGVPADDDNPIDLLLDQNIVISINPAWTTIHNLGIGDNNPI